MKFKSTEKDFTKAIQEVKENISVADTWNAFICTNIMDIKSNHQIQDELKAIVLDYRFRAEELFNAEKNRGYKAFWLYNNKKDRIDYLNWIKANLPNILNGKTTTS